MHLIQNIKKNIRILDVGCGYGSEAILCSAIGGKVLGIDLSEDRIAIAKKRVKYFENKLERDLDIKFSLGNLFNHYGEYDLIWANEAIHHIAPLNEFLNISLQNLKIGGKLIITDQNRLNPYPYILSKRAQKKYGGIYIIKKDTRMEEAIHYAIERIFTLREIKKILTKIFRNVEIYPFSYFPFFIYKVFNKYCMKIERKYIRKLPIIKLFSVGYTAICIKKNESIS